MKWIIIMKSNNEENMEKGKWNNETEIMAEMKKWNENNNVRRNDEKQIMKERK